MIFQQISTELYMALMYYFVQRAVTDKCRTQMKYLEGKAKRS
jgi:hypothetical protein